MNYFEKCKKRIEKGSRIERTGNNLVVEDDLVLSCLIGVDNQCIYEVEFINVKVPLTSEEAEELYKLADIKRNDSYSHRAQTILSML